MSAQTPTISLNPSSVSGVSTGSTFSVNVTISSASNIYGWQVNITFNPSVLTVEGATEGSFLKSVIATVWVTSIANDRGFVLASSSPNPPYPSAGVNGSGVLATITFKVKSSGGSDLDFVDGTKLRTIQAGNLLPIDIFSTQDGSYAGGGGTGGSGFGLPLEIIAVVAVVVIVAVVGGVFYLRRRK